MFKTAHFLKWFCDLTYNMTSQVTEHNEIYTQADCTVGRKKSTPRRGQGQYGYIDKQNGGCTWDKHGQKINNGKLPIEMIQNLPSSRRTQAS